jgi:hypothetical protein
LYYVVRRIRTTINATMMATTTTPAMPPPMAPTRAPVLSPWDVVEVEPWIVVADGETGVVVTTVTEAGVMEMEVEVEEEELVVMLED